MWAPILISVGILGLFKLALFSQSHKPATKTIASGTQSRSPRTSFASYNADLAKRLRDERPIPQWLVSEAMREAYDAGDWHLLRALSRSFDKPDPTESDEPETEPVPKQETQEPLIVIGKNSPIQGVTNDDWSSFVDKLETKGVGYRDDKHVGAYYHHKNRLAEIGVDAESLTDKQAQYTALETDLKDALTKYRKLINDWSGDVVTLGGKPVSITRSGILGLIKAAGASGATEWLKDESQRLKYPMTTEMFTRTNGLF